MLVSRVSQISFISKWILIRNDVIIEKMAVLVGGFRHVLIRINQNELSLWLSQHGSMKVKG